MSSLTLRVSLILSGALLLVALALASALHYQQRQDSGNGMRLPLPEQAAAIVELIEVTPPEQLPLVLNALNSGTLHVVMSAQPPQALVRDTPLPGVSWALRAYIDKLGGRSVQALAGERESANAEARAERPLRLVVGLRDGRYAVLEARGGVLRYLLGLRLLSAAFLLLLLIGGGSLWLLRRQIRPLEQVVGAVERFGENIAAPSLPERGALEVRRLVSAFNRMQTRIRALVEGRTRMLAAISHDLGTYLTRLRLRAEFIADPGQRERAIRDIEEMEALMSDTLALSDIERDTGPDETVDLAALLLRQVEGFSASGRPVILHGAAPAWVQGKAGALGRVISNLIGNAIKHAGAAEVTLHRADGVVELLVEDRGPGIAPELRELVLEPFYRHDPARNLDVPGFGLGLAIVADIVRRHHGRLLLEDRPGGGLRARVTLNARKSGVIG